MYLYLLSSNQSTKEYSNDGVISTTFDIIGLLALNIFRGLHWIYIDLWPSRKTENAGK